MRIHGLHQTKYGSISKSLKPLWKWGMQALSLARVLPWHAQLQMFSPAALRNVLWIRASSGFIEMAAGVQEVGGEVYLIPIELENSNPHRIYCKIKTSLNLGHISVLMCVFLLTQEVFNCAVGLRRATGKWKNQQQENHSCDGQVR